MIGAEFSVADFYEREVDGEAVFIVDEWCWGFMKGLRLDTAYQNGSAGYLHVLAAVPAARAGAAARTSAPAPYGGPAARGGGRRLELRR